MNDNKKHIKTGFKTPEDYFNTFETNLFEQLQIETKTGYKIPENYFDTLEDDVLKKIKPPKTKVISLIGRRQLAYISTIAAMLVFSFFILKPSDIQKLTFDDVEYTAFEEYLSDENIDISANELAELYNINTSDLDDIYFSNIEEDNILEYLSDETISEDYFDSEL
jgi:hypothetical protein